MFSQSTINSFIYRKHDKGHQIAVTVKTLMFISVNHTASSGAMETAGVIEMLRKSIERSNLVYHEYLRDSNTTSFKPVVDSKPYEE